MTVGQLFLENSGRKTVWTKRGDELTKRQVTSVFSVKPRVKIETVKEPNQ